MKKIINQTSLLVKEMCHGIELAHPNLSWNRSYNVLSRKVLSPNKVTLISGGGSGHEPAHAGLVGYGILDAAVCGDVFASPSQVQVYKAICETKSDRGTLLIIKNYSGDIMNFKNAATLAQEDGIEVDYVKVDDDIAVQDSLYTVGHRGVAGTIFVHKIAGAAAERGDSLAQVKAVAQNAIDHVKTIGFAETSCTVPAKGTPTFELGESEIEYGVGIHGEPGICKQPMASADVLAQDMVDRILQSLDVTDTETEIALLVNGLGGTPLQELYILNHSVQKVLSNYPKLTVVHTLVGNYMTSIDMCGASISILALDEELKELLLAPCATATLSGTWSGVTVPYTNIENMCEQTAERKSIDSNWSTICGDVLTKENVIYLVDAMKECIIKNEVPFCELDAHAGDGDFGMSIAKGFRQLDLRWNELISNEGSISDFLHSCSMIIMEHCGGASGPIWGSAFRAAAKSSEGHVTLDRAAMSDLVQAIVRGIQLTGERSFGRGAQVGDKTLIDALIPCADSWIEYKDTKNLKELLMLGARAAVAGAQYTENIVARMGRAGTVGTRSLGHPDAGAYALGVIFTEISEKMNVEN